MTIQLEKKLYLSIFDKDHKFCLNADLIRNGFAIVSTSPYLKKEEFVKPLDELKKQEEKAKSEKLNLWSSGDIYENEDFEWE